MPLENPFLIPLENTAGISPRVHRRNLLEIGKKTSETPPRFTSEIPQRISSVISQFF